MHETDPRRIADRLGVNEITVRRLQRRGYLRALDAGEAELKARLFWAHSRFARAVARGER